MNIIIDAKSLITGKRLSVSIDDYLFALYTAKDWRSRSFVRAAIEDGIILNSRDARRFIYNQICKPSILRSFNALPEIQMDIDDI